MNRISTKYVRVFALLIIMMTFGCNNSFTSEEELWSFVKKSKNGFLQNKIVNSVDFSLLYKPTDLMVQQELGTTYTQDNVKNLRVKYKEFVYLNLSISKNGNSILGTSSSDRNEYSKMVNMMSFQLKEKVNLITSSKDTIKPIDFIFPRLYGMSKASTILFIFPRSPKIKDSDYLNFSIEDFGLNTGQVKFKIPSDRIKIEPTIQFKN